MTNTDRSMMFIEQEHIPQNAPQVYVMTQGAAEALAVQEKIDRRGGMRLTHAMRASVMEKVYDFKFKKSGDKLDAQELRLSHKAMVACFGKTALETLAKVGPPYAYTAHSHEDGSKLVEAELAEWRGSKIQWRLANGYQVGMYVKDPLPRQGYQINHHFIVKSESLTNEVMAWRDACDEWLKAKREMELKVNAVLNSVTTFNSLQKTWPAGEQFWKHLPIDFPFRNQVPAVKVEELNAALGLD